MENGLTEEQIKMVFGLMKRIAPAMQSQGEDFEMSPRLENYFVNEIKLTEEQIEFVMALASRVAGGMKKKQGPDLGGIFKRIQPLLVENGLTEEQIEKVFGLMKRIAPAIQSQGEDFEVSPRLEGYLVKEVGLTDEQTKLVLELTQRIALGMKEREEVGPRVDLLRFYLDLP